MMSKQSKPTKNKIHLLNEKIKKYILNSIYTNKKFFLILLYFI